MRWIAILLAAAFPFLARAISPGTLEVGGDTTLRFESSKLEIEGDPDSQDTKRFELGLVGLYYITPNLAAGGFLQYDSETTEVAGAEDGLKTLLVGPAIGLDLPLQEKLSFFAQAGVGYQSATFTQTGSPDVDFSGWAFIVRGGLKYFVVKSFSLDAALQFNRSTVTGDAPGPGLPEPELTSTGFGLSLGLSVYFGG
jgi:opacity protein-like surface antigen